MKYEGNTTRTIFSPYGHLNMTMRVFLNELIMMQ